MPAGDPNKTPTETLLEYRVTGLEDKLKLIIGGTGVTFLTVVCAAFWLGSTLGTVNTTVQNVDTTVKNATDRINVVHDAVFQSKDNLMTRTSLIEAKLDTMDKKLDKLLEPRTSTTTTVRGTSEPAPNPR